MNNIELKLVAENEELKLKYLDALAKNMQLAEQNINLLKQIGKYQLYEIAPMEKAKDVMNEIAKDFPKLKNIPKVEEKRLNHQNLAKELKITDTQLSKFKTSYKELFGNKLPNYAKRGVYTQTEYDFIKSEYLKFKGTTNE
jgi:DNA-binding Xre family transcriptional regulator